MTDTNADDVTASEHRASQSTVPSLYQVAEAINQSPAEWFYPDERTIIAHSVGDVDADEMKEALEAQKLPDGTDFSALQGVLRDVSSQYKEAVTDYLNSPDEWNVVTPDEQNPWDALKRLYGDDVTSKRKARQHVVDHLREDLHLVPLSETEDLLRYNPETGVYEADGERVVRERLECGLQKYNTPGEANQIVYKLKNHQSRSLDEFTPEGRVCLKNGVLDVSDPTSPVLDDHAPEPRFRKRLPVEYDEEATCPRFKRFIQETVADEDRAKLQEFIGYTVFHPWEIRYQKALMVVGPTAAGKSTFLDVMTTLLGDSNTCHLSLQQLVDDEFARANVIGTVANICNDLNAKNVRNVGLFKQLTGDDRVEANRKYEDYLTFRMTQKQIYAANRVPEIDYDDDAFYRRWLHVRFPETVPQDDRDAQLKRKLKEELPGILNWVLEGYARLRANDGFTDELSTDEKRELWKAHGHSIDRFMQSRAEQTPGNEQPKDTVYRAYKRFCEANGISPEAKETFGKYLKDEYGITTSRPAMNGERVYCYRGIYLPEEGDEPDRAGTDGTEWMETNLGDEDAGPSPLSPHEVTARSER